MSENYLDERRENFRSEQWLINAKNRETTKTEEQRELDKQFWEACLGRNRERSVDLFEKGATNDYQWDGRSALHFACYHGDRNIDAVFLGRTHFDTTNLRIC